MALACRGVLSDAFGVDGNEFRSRLLPIGMQADGFCLAAKTKHAGKVYVWDHANERVEDDYRTFFGRKAAKVAFCERDVYLASSGNFLSRLEKDSRLYVVIVSGLSPRDDATNV